MSKYQEKRQETVDYLIEAMEKGTAPWQQNWEKNKMPHNAGSGYQYRGGNAARLMTAQIRYPQFADDSRWCTFKQASDNGWKIRKGEKALAHTEYWVFQEKQFVKDDKTGKLEEKMVNLDRPKVMVYPMFNATQIEGIPPAEQKRHEWDPVEKAEELLQKSGASIEHQGEKALYRPSKDLIIIPKKDRFSSPEAYYATALHELGHWTGHKDRLNREQPPYSKDPKTYAREELVAEISSMFVQPEVGLKMPDQHKEHHAAYVDYYIQILKKDPNEFFRAVADADKAADYVLKRDHTHTQTQKVEEASAKVNMSATQSIDPQKIADIKEFLKSPKQQNIKVYPAKYPGCYNGEIKHIDKKSELVIQQIGKISFVVHNLKDLGRPTPEKGDNLKITYHNEHKVNYITLSMIPQKENTNKQTRSR